MKYIEIFLKLAFLIISVMFIITNSIDSSWFFVSLLVSFLLGIILIINKNSSYNYPQTDRDYLIRRIEGVLLLIFSLTAFFLIY